MSNRWGRDGSGSGGQTGSGTVVFAVIVSLVIGVAGGYGVFRSMGSPGGREEIADREQRIEALSRDLEAARLSEAEQARRADGLEQAHAGLRRQFEQLRASIDASEAELQAENARLAQDVVPGLEARAQALANRVETLEADLRDTARELAESERRAGEAAAELSRIRAERDQSDADDTAQHDEAVRRLEGELSALGRERDELRSRLEGLSTRDIPDLERAIEARDREVRELTALNRDLAATIGRLEAAGEGAAETPGADAATTPEGDIEEQADTRSPRAVAAVERAMEGAPGLGFLSEAEKVRLRDSLVSGDCVTVALDSVFDRVPVLALRNLMRDLGSDC